jgi:Uma2 family endonuclease
MLVTAEEYGALEDRTDGNIDELIDGVVVVCEPMNKPIHGFVCANVGYPLGTYAKETRYGWGAMRCGFILRRNPDTVRAPDLSFFSYARAPVVPKEYTSTAPDLAVEVLSPENRRSYIRDKVKDFFIAGVRLVWVVNPEDKTVMVYAGSMRGTEYDESDTLDGGDVLPGFTCKVADFFE